MILFSFLLQVLCIKLCSKLLVWMRGLLFTLLPSLVMYINFTQKYLIKLITLLLEPSVIGLDSYSMLHSTLLMCMLIMYVDRSKWDTRLNREIKELVNWTENYKIDTEPPMHISLAPWPKTKGCDWGKIWFVGAEVASGVSPSWTPPAVVVGLIQEKLWHGLFNTNSSQVIRTLYNNK